MSFIEVVREGDVLHITLNRPQRLNAIHLPMRDELWEVFNLIRDDPTILVAVLSGAGDRAFSAGADITDFGTASSVIEAREARLNRDLWGVMSRIEIPFIAAIHGFTYGAGFEMSMYCDIRLADETAQFALPEVTLGYIPSAGGTQMAPRHFPLSDAMLLTTSGNAIDAWRAYELGFVDSVLEPRALIAEANRLAECLASNRPSAVRAVKRAVVRGLDLSLDAGLALERRITARQARLVSA